jgi:hypothetical protein
VGGHTGDLTDTYTEDDNEFVINELAGSTPGFDYHFYFGEDDPVTRTLLKVNFKAWYEGLNAHKIKLQQWNYSTLAWVNVTSNTTDFPDETEENAYGFNLIDHPHYLSGGVIRLRIYQVQAGVGGHHFHIDQMYLEELPSASPSAS